MSVSDEAKKALEGVTPGPWTYHAKGIHPHPFICGATEIYEHGEDRPVVAYVVGMNTDANARLIAASRELVPALLDEIAAKDAEIARLRGEIIEATDENFIWGAMDNVHDADTTLDDYAAAVSRAQRAALKGDTHE